jgi:hypothetical protein
MILLLRKLTRKSKMGFGQYRDLTVQDLLDQKRGLHIVAAYYALGNITFEDDILDELGIPEDERINKPGKDLEMRTKAVKGFYERLNKGKSLLEKFKEIAHRRKEKRLYAQLVAAKMTPCRAKLQGLNHGHVKRF